MNLLDLIPDLFNAVGIDKIKAVSNMITSNTNAVGGGSSPGSSPGSNENVTVNDFFSYVSDIATDTMNNIGNTPVEDAVESSIKTAVQISNQLDSNDSNSNVSVSQSTDSHKQATEHVKNSTPDSKYIDKKRLVEMHVYQEKKYQAYLDILNQFTFYCIILLILAILKKRFIISYSFTQILIMILIVISGIHMYLKIADVNMRNNVDFDEYDWSFTADSQSDPNKIDTNLHENTQTGGASCVEAACCNPDFTRWCSTQGLCVSKDTADCPEEQVMPDK